MPLQRRLLQPLYSRVLTSPATRQLWRSTRDWLGRVSGQPPRLVYRLRMDDPVCCLLTQVLPALLEHYPLELELRLLPPQSGLPAHATLDAWHLAQFHQLRFHSLTPPAQADCWLAARILLGLEDLPPLERLALLKQLFTCVWEHQGGKLATLALRFPPLDEESALLRLEQARLEADRLPDGGSGVLDYRGERFIGLDDLPELISRLESAGLNRLEHAPGLGDAGWPASGFLVTDSEMLAEIRSRRYRLDFYFCFCDPYSYLNLESMLALVDHYGLRLRLRPVTVPRSGKLAERPLPPVGLLWQSARHAGARRLDFGEICLPDAAGLLNCHALLAHAAHLGRERDMAESILAGIWARGRDMNHRPHLLAVLREAGFRKADLDTLLADATPELANRHAAAWHNLDLPGLPGFVLETAKPVALCGEDRLWALDMTLADTLNNNKSDY
jgi:2-hydroxychromene-2-carboxylate isomerase